MQIDEPVLRNLEETGRYQLAIRNHDDSIGSAFFQTRIDLFRFEAVGLNALDLMGTGNINHGRRGEDLVPTDRAVRSRDNQHDLVSALHQLLEAGHGKIGGAEEDDFHDASVYTKSRSHHRQELRTLSGVSESLSGSPSLSMGKPGYRLFDTDCDSDSDSDQASNAFAAILSVSFEIIETSYTFTLLIAGSGACS